MKPYIQIQQEQKENLDRLIEYAGNKARLARALNVSIPVVCNWVARGRISAMCAIEAERITRGAITKTELRPDVEKWIDEQE